jgi:LacI family transcriptional regulator
MMQRLLDGERRVERLEIKPDELKVRLSSAVSNSSDSVVARAQGYIERRLTERFTVDDVARFAGASRRKLEMRFKSALGTAPAEYIRNKRMKLAERLLRESGLSVRDVSARCAAGSLQAFTAQFKLRHGVPPGRYRQIHS